MGKVVKFTGSKVLGAELKRLRGQRTLAEISNLTKALPLSDRIGPISAPTLCQIESGQTMPTLDTLHSVATVYRVNPQRLYDLIVEDRLTQSQAVPASLDEARTAFAEALQRGAPDRALAIAIHAEQLSHEPASRVGWIANRASCLRQLGMQQDAIWLYLECAENPGLPAERLFYIHLNLADAYSAAGLFSPAERHARLAEQTAPSTLDAATRSLLERAHAMHLLRACEAGLAGETQAREAGRRATAAAALMPTEDEADRLTIELLRCLAERWSGNRLQAREGLAALVKQAESGKHPPVVVWAALNLGALLRDMGAPVAARRMLTKAEGVAAELKQIDEAFEVAFELWSLAREEGASVVELSRLERRCQRFHPLLNARTPRAIEYERLTQEGGR